MKKKKILVIDNYDSFTYNLVYLLKKFTKNTIEVFRNDYISLQKINNYDKILISPGPGLPKKISILKPLIKNYAPFKSLFGICLGQQAIAEVFGCKLINTKKVYHGVSSKIKILDTKEKIFKNIPNIIDVGRYHSWIVSRENFSKDLIITAESYEGEIMAIRHINYDVIGVQFHPESILTPQGKNIIFNWLNNDK